MPKFKYNIGDKVWTSTQISRYIMGRRSVDGTNLYCVAPNVFISERAIDAVKALKCSDKVSGGVTC